MPDWTFLITMGTILVILGFFLVAFSIMRSISEDKSSAREEQVRGGGVILIGPIPVVFGTDKRFTLIAMILAIVLMLLAIIFLR